MALPKDVVCTFLVLALLLILLEKSSAARLRSLCIEDDVTQRDPWAQFFNREALVHCTDGFADVFPCSNVDLMSFISREVFNNDTLVNDIWGWTDPITKIEYAILGSFGATHFLDLYNPNAPLYLGYIPSSGTPAQWHDMKTYKDHVYIVSDRAGHHGMQVYDLRELRSIARDDPNLPLVLNETVHYNETGSAHNLVINEETGFAYIVGDRDSCQGGLHMVDIGVPNNPIFAGCYSEDGYTHDAQCVLYRGPHLEYQGHEICFACNEDTLTIVDVTAKNAAVMLSRYVSEDIPFVYSHQGWLTEDHRTFFLDDESDELRNRTHTRTFIIDVTNLTNPFIDFVYTNELSNSTDHNQYVAGDRLYQSNYRSGLRILDISQRESGQLRETGYFDTVPDSDDPGFRGAWSVYPYFTSGNLIVSSMKEGFFVLRYNNSEDTKAPSAAPITPAPTRPPTQAPTRPSLSRVGGPFDTPKIPRPFPANGN